MSRKILLADDSVTIQKVIELTFMDEDYEVKAVSNGDEALAALPTVSPDFVIADVHMPGANGYEVCRRSKEIRPDVPVLLLVGTFEPFDEGQARAAGADSFLKKPFDSQELLQRVQDLLASRHAPAAAPAAAASTAIPATPPPLPHLGTTPMFAAPEPPTLAFNATPFRQQAAAAEPDWGSFELDPEPQHAHSAFAAPEPYEAEPFPLELSPLEPSPLDPSPLDQTQPSAPLEANPFLEEHSPFVLEDDRSAAAYPVEESPRLPDDVTMFDRESPPPFRLEPHPAAPELGALSDIDFEDVPRPAVHPPAGFGAPWTGDDTNPEVQHLGVPESAVPLVHDLAETEARIEAPPPASILDSHEPEAAAWSPPPPPPPPEKAAPEPWSIAAERSLPPTAPLVPPPYTPPPFTPPAAPLPVGSVSTSASTNGGGRLSDEDVDRIARRVVELIGDKTVRDVAWEVVPDMAEAVIRDRLRELESQVENSAE